ncbi:hypothetical protein GCM10010234_28620 [Streptomyces hawaiiensis]
MGGTEALAVGRGQVPHEDLQLADGLGAQHPLDALGVFVRGEAAFGQGVVQEVGHAVALGVGGTELGGGGRALLPGILLPGIRLLEVLLLKVHGSSVPKHDRSRHPRSTGECDELSLTSQARCQRQVLRWWALANGGGPPSVE